MRLLRATAHRTPNTLQYDSRQRRMGRARATKAPPGRRRDVAGTSPERRRNAAGTPPSRPGANGSDSVSSGPGCQSLKISPPPRETSGQGAPSDRAIPRTVQQKRCGCCVRRRVSSPAESRPVYRHHGASLISLSPPYRVTPCPCDWESETRPDRRALTPTGRSY